MLCRAYSSNEMYKYKLAKTRVNVLNNLYHKQVLVMPHKAHENLRLRLRFKEAIHEAEHLCKHDMNSEECHMAWDEVDELEDSMLRYYLDLR